MNDRYLMHYGVKGMKWGVRKDKIKTKTKAEREVRGKRYAGVQSLVRESRNATNSLVSAYYKTKTYRDRKRSELSNARKRSKRVDVSKIDDKELQQLVNRLNLEQNYKRLTGGDPDVALGRQRTEAILGSVGDVLAASASVLGIISAVNSLKNG